VKLGNRKFQERRNEKVGCRFHLLICGSEVIWKLMINERKQQKKAEPNDPTPIFNN
jgi:hypothetical protein